MARVGATSDQPTREYEAFLAEVGAETVSTSAG